MTHPRRRTRSTLAPGDIGPLGRRPKRVANAPSSEPAGPVPEPDQAWKALSLVNDWIRHAEAKTGATLAAAGVSGGVLFNLLKGQKNKSGLLNVVAVLCAASILLCALAAVVALVPRLDIQGWERRRATRNERFTSAPPPGPDDDPDEDPTSLLFFDEIARTYGSDDAPTYAQVLATLTADKARLTRHIGRQVHANAHIARRKYRWSTWAIRALSLDLVFLAVTVIIVATD